MKVDMSAPTGKNARQLEAALRRFLPDPGAVAAAPAEVPPADWSLRFPSEAERVVRAIESRRAECFTGRECARRCLEGLGSTGGELPPDAEGLPVWPDGFSGSISHSRGLCLAVVVPGRLCPLIGVDLERLDRISEAAAARVIHPDERAFAGADRDRATVLFGLKEAFFKCQYPRWRAQPGFHDLSLEVEPGAGRARIHWIREDLPDELRSAAVAMQFRFAVSGPYVASLSWIEAE